MVGDIDLTGMCPMEVVLETGCPFVAEGKVCPMDSNPFQRRVFNHIPRVGRLGGLEKVYVDSFSRSEHRGLERQAI